jgi:hypothetical protein
MLEKLLQEIKDNGFDVQFPTATRRIILVDLVEEIIKKHITKENAEKWLQEELSHNQTLLQ